MKPLAIAVLFTVVTPHAWAASEYAEVTVPAPPITVPPGYPTTPTGIFVFNVGVISPGIPEETPLHYLKITAMGEYQWQVPKCTGGRGGGCEPNSGYETAKSNKSASHVSSTAFQNGEAVSAKFTFTYHGTLDFQTQTTNFSQGDSYSLTLFDEYGHAVGLNSPLHGTYVLQVADNAFKTGQMLNVSTSPLATPIPGSIWLMMSASIGLFGMPFGGKFRFLNPVTGSGQAKVC